MSDSNPTSPTFSVAAHDYDDDDIVDQTPRDRLQTGETRTKAPYADGDGAYDYYNLADYNPTPDRDFGTFSPINPRFYADSDTEPFSDRDAARDGVDCNDTPESDALNTPAAFGTDTFDDGGFQVYNPFEPDPLAGVPATATAMLGSWSPVNLYSFPELEPLSPPPLPHALEKPRAQPLLEPYGSLNLSGTTSSEFSFLPEETFEPPTSPFIQPQETWDTLSPASPVPRKRSRPQPTILFPDSGGASLWLPGEAPPGNAGRAHHPPPSILEGNLPHHTPEWSQAPAAALYHVDSFESSEPGTRRKPVHAAAALVPIDAPTQPRKYITHTGMAAASSWKDVPATLARKRSARAALAFADDDDDDDEEVVQTSERGELTERELIEYRRRQNTVAARRSRLRKLRYQQGLEAQVKAFKLEEGAVRARERAPVFCQERLGPSAVSVAPRLSEDEEVRPSQCGMWKENQCIASTADQASLHAHLLEPALRMALGGICFEGEYMIQVGFNETMLSQGILVEEIHLLLDGDLRMTENDVCTIFEPVFAPFPVIMYTHGQTYYIPIDPPADGPAGRRLDLELGRVWVAGDGGTSGTSGNGDDMEGVVFTGGSGSSSGKLRRENTGNQPGARMPPGGGGGPDDGGDSSGDDDGDEDKGKGGGPSRHKGKGRLCGPRIISIPLHSTLSIKGSANESHRVNTAAGIDITVNEDQTTPPAHTEWGGPWFKVDITKLEINSMLANQPSYFLSFAQVRIVASSVPDSLTLLDRWPKSSFKETDSAKTTISNSRGLNLEMALGLSPSVKTGFSMGQASGVERSTNRWAVASHADTDAVQGVPEAESDIAVWKYTHNDNIFNRVEGWTFDRDLCPSVLFGFEQINTEVQVEVTAFWSSNNVDSEDAKRREFPILWRRAKANKSIFCNFIYQVAAAVDIGKVPYERSWIMPGKKPHVLEREVLSAMTGPIDLHPATAVAKKYSKSGQLDGVVSTDCEVFMKAIVEGRVNLTAAERTGRRPLALQPPSQILSPNALSTAGRTALLTPSPSPQPLRSDKKDLAQTQQTSEVIGEYMQAVSNKKRKL